jgi:hypothetical protein
MVTTEALDLAARLAAVSIRGWCFALYPDGRIAMHTSIVNGNRPLRVFADARVSPAAIQQVIAKTRPRVEQLSRRLWASGGVAPARRPARCAWCDEPYAEGVTCPWCALAWQLVLARVNAPVAGVRGVEISGRALCRPRPARERPCTK